MSFTVWKAVKEMIFSELYSTYYHTVAAVLAEAVSHPLSNDELKTIVESQAFGESILSIPSALKEERWKLLKPDRTTPIKRKPDMPLTTLQKRWLKSIAQDPRLRLFGEFDLDFPDVEPLFLPEDILVFDRYNDGDAYEDETYIANFRIILNAVRKKYPLYIETKNRRGEVLGRTIFPESLEYSEKDDKFRLIGAGDRRGNTINLGRIVNCRPSEKISKSCGGQRGTRRQRSVVFELKDRRNALERALLHFAHFRKQAEKIADDRYQITVYYDKEDETEIVIRVLSFGPLIRVTAPQHFIGLIKQRLMDQKSCGQ